MQSAIQRCREFLRQRLAASEYDLRTSSIGDDYCPIENAGHVFTAFFVVEAMQGVLSAAEEARLLLTLHQERRGGVWGYSREAPVDVDDSAFVYRTLLRLGKAVSVEPLLRFYRKDQRAFTTFQFDGPARLVESPHVEGNHQIHAAVNANVFSLMVEARRPELANAELILAGQRPDGSWGGYFYPGPCYATALCTRFLALLPESHTVGAALGRAAGFIENAQNAEGCWGGPPNAYETALALDALAAVAPDSPCIRRGIDALLQHQLPDGSWANEATIWEYYLRMEPVVVWRAHDHHRTLVSALALKALAAFAARVS